MIFALAGNQNCGKTTLFNALTGSDRRVGNFPGVTVDCASGEIKSFPGHTVVDLPGTYSLRPYSGEERVTRDFLLDGKPDCIINILDASSVERNLCLTLQLASLGIPTVLAFNMMDEVRASGGFVDTAKIGGMLGMPAVPISALRGEGIAELVKTAMRCAESHAVPDAVGLYPHDKVSACIDAVSDIIGSRSEKSGIPARFAAEMLVADDAVTAERLKPDPSEARSIAEAVTRLERDLDTDRLAAVAGMRYSLISRICAAAVRLVSGESRGHLRSLRADRILTGKFTAIPVFIAVMLLIFVLTFEVVGAGLSELLGAAVSSLTDAAGRGLESAGASEAVVSLVTDGVFAGVGSVLSFLPVIVVLFLFLSLLEDSGYMARIAFVADKPLRKIGLTGKSIVPLLMGFGCSVPAVMATRTMTNGRDRLKTVMLVPFMSCSAKITVYSFFTSFFFENRKALVMLLLYLLGIAVGVTVTALSDRTVFRDRTASFMMELPDYRMPGIKTTLVLIREKAKGFLQKTFTVIFAASVAVWFLRSFGTDFRPVSDPSSSILASFGKLAAPLFAPLGFGDWRAPTALIAGFTAKEAVVSTLEVLLGGALPSSMLSPVTAMSFMIFTLLYTPCIAAVSVIKRELGSFGKAAALVVFQCASAWLCAFAFYRLHALL